MARASLELDVDSITDSERTSLREIEQLIAHAQDRDTPLPRLVGVDGESVELPASLVPILQKMVHHLAEGQPIALVPSEKYLTTQQAADLLNISRPFLITLLEREEIPYTKTGTHRRIRFEDAINYKVLRDAHRTEALAELTRLSQELGFYDEQ